MAHHMTRRNFLQVGAAAVASSALAGELALGAAPSGGNTRMRTSMNVLVWTTYLTSEHFPILEKLKKMGYDGVELPIFQAAGENTEAHYAMIGKELKRLGLGCTAVTVMTPETNPVSPDPAVRQAGVEWLKTAIRCIAAAGGDVVCGPIHSALGVFSGSAPTDEERKRAVEVIRAAADEAKAANVRLAIEFLCRFEAYVLTTARDTAAMVKQIEHPSVGMLYDTFHANIEEKDPVKSLEEVMPYVVHFHVSENDRGTPGAGHVPWKGTFNALRKGKYKGWLTVEAFGRSMPEIAAATRVWRDFFASPDALCEDSLKFMKKMARLG